MFEMLEMRDGKPVSFLIQRNKIDEHKLNLQARDFLDKTCLHLLAGLLRIEEPEAMPTSVRAIKPKKIY